ncbi:MAG: hypothetical protein NWE92_13400 [Candidatus Bathyarchaeota archaeon]|nr:hypothetical protein [Candidatus Bathyarchaeota archaeon]
MAASKPNKVKATQIIPVIILIGSVVGALYFAGFFDDFLSGQSFTGANDDGFSDGGILTPTRDIEGTWKTTFATEFIIATDYENFGTLADVGTENRTMTWTITGTSDEHIVRVDVAFSYSNRQLASGSGYTPDVSPMQLTGIINGTQLTLTRGDAGPIEQIGSVGVFTFTSTQMQGTWHDHWSGVYEQNVYTLTNDLKLMKQ